jgi:DNA-directed RNA polymerase specialized sigma24 family protein
MRRNDRSAETFSELYRRTYVDVLAFLLRRCSSAEDAADCLAETYLLAWKKRDQMPTGAETRPWLFGVARNVMRRGNELLVRTAAAADALAAELERSGAICPAPDLPEPDPVIAAIRDLPELEQEIITMLIWDELAPRESRRGPGAHAQRRARASPPRQGQSQGSARRRRSKRHIQTGPHLELAAAYALNSPEPAHAGKSNPPVQARANSARCLLEPSPQHAVHPATSVPGRRMATNTKRWISRG